MSGTQRRLARAPPLLGACRMAGSYQATCYMIPLFKVYMAPGAPEVVGQVLTSGFLTQGSKVEEYEEAVKSYLGCNRVLSLVSATAGLTLALRLLMEPDPSFSWPGFDRTSDVVLTPALTCFATTCGVLGNGVKLRWIDTERWSPNISLEDVRAKLNERTKVIYLVHWGGYPVDLDALDEVCEAHKAKYGFKPMVVEDCAHAFGAEYNGKKIGTHGNICVFSTQAIKLLTTGDGGIMRLPHGSLYERARLLRWFGIDRDKRNYKGKDFRLEHDIAEYGYKYHMNDINATIGLHNLSDVPPLLEKIRANAQHFDQALSGVPGIKLMRKCDGSDPAHWLYTICVLNGKKQEFMDKMKEAGIMTSQVHNRNDSNSCVSEFREQLPNLDLLEKELVCIPVGWWLSEDDVANIVGGIARWRLDP